MGICGDGEALVSSITGSIEINRFELVSVVGLSKTNGCPLILSNTQPFKSWVYPLIDCRSPVSIEHKISPGSRMLLRQGESTGFIVSRLCRVSC